MNNNALSNVETHPFEIFIPPQMKYLIIGSFPGRGQTEVNPKDDHWFYGAKRNTFWKILEQVYDIPLKDKKAKQDLFVKVRIGIGDIILKAVRKNGTNSDGNLEIIEFNTAAIKKALQNCNIKIIFFTGKFVEKHFKKLFPQVSNTIVLPSPSPRFARITLTEKIALYKRYLPELL